MKTSEHYTCRITWALIWEFAKARLRGRYVRIRSVIEVEGNATIYSVIVWPEVQDNE